MTTYIYLVLIILSFISVVLVLELARRKAIENIRTHSYTLLLSYYEGKIDSICMDKGKECREKLAAILARELSAQIRENKIKYIDLEELYKKISSK